MPKLILICGTSFAGKSTIARLLTDRFGFPEVDVDQTKTDLYGQAVIDGDLARADWERIYRETDRRLAGHLASGRSVIDASRNFRLSERRQARAICQEHNADLLTILVDTPEHVTRQRLLSNRQSPARRDVTDEDFAAILAAWEPPTPDEQPLVLHFGDDQVEWITRNAEDLYDR
jgi:predicted kinase